MLPVSTLSRRINGERIVLIGWTRAILLQLAHPLVAAGVADHSTFRRSPRSAWSRLQHTVHAMLAITFGTEAEQEAALETIRAIHRRVHGSLGAACGRFASGTRYSAEDPDLLLWVHATLIESIALVYDQLVTPLSERERDAYCADSADVAIALGARPEEVPRCWQELQTYLRGQYESGSIAVSDQARAVASAMLAPITGPVRVPIATVTGVLASGLLPDVVRREYGLAWTPRRDWVFRVAISLLRAGRRLSPAVVTSWQRARAGTGLPTSQ